MVANARRILRVGRSPIARLRENASPLVRRADSRMRGRGAGAGAVYLLDWNDWTFTRSSEAAMADPRSGWAFQAATEAANWLGTDVPRIFADGAILIEGAETNEIPYSADFSTWTASNATLTTDQTNAPDGSSSTADLLEGAGGGSPKEITLATGLSTGDVTFSCWVKKATYTGTCTLELDDGTTQVATSPTLTDSWQRVSVTLSSAAGAVTAAIQVPTGAADVYIWGAQIEAAAFPSSDIRTAGVSATRADDQVTTTVTAEHVDGWLKKDKEWFFDLVLNFSSIDNSPSNLTAFCVGNRLIRIYRSGSSGGEWILQGGSTKALQVTLTTVPWSAGDTLRFTVRTPDADNWFFRCENLDTGTSNEGTSAGAVTHATLLGQTMQAGSYQPAPASYYISGVMSRPWHNL